MLVKSIKSTHFLVIKLVKGYLLQLLLGQTMATPHLNEYLQITTKTKTREGGRQRKNEMTRRQGKQEEHSNIYCAF